MKQVKRIISLMLVLIMCMGMLSTFASAAVVKKGSSGTEVRQVQYNLNVLGFNVGTVDGVCGNKTVEQIKRYQKVRKLEVDGMAGPETQKNLKTEVKEIQNLLKKNGWYSDTVDGIAGPNTIAGVKKFQKDARMDPTGRLNDASIKKLREWKRINPPTPAKSTLKIGSGNYKPGTLTQGSSYSISGNITSNYKITSVTVGVYNSNGKATAQVKTVKPNAMSYNINKVDNNIRFGSLAAGTYYFKVIAKDAGGGNLSINHKFTVKKAPTPIPPSGGGSMVSVGYRSKVDKVLKSAAANKGKGRSALGYTSDWCAYYVSDILRDNGIPIVRSANGRDLVINALNDGMGTYYSFRNKNITSMTKKQASWSIVLKRTDLAVKTNKNKVTPQPGDIVIFLWSNNAEAGYNWSHVGFVKSYSNGELKTIEGNTGGGTGVVAEVTRYYDSSTIVGLLRLK